LSLNAALFGEETGGRGHDSVSTHFRLLGPVEVWAQGGRVDIGHPKQRSVLAALLLDVNEVTPTATLIDRVWDDDPPASARNVLYSYLANLRSALAGADAELVRRSGGYLLLADPDSIDLHRGRRLIARTREETTSDDRAAALLSEALRQWRGTPFANLNGPWFERMRHALEAERRVALLRRNDLYLHHGRHVELLSELHELSFAQPLDEHLARQLMLALYRSGHRAAAFEHYQRVRRTLADELGVDPGPDLRELHRQMLRNDLTLGVPPPAVAPRPVQRLPRS